ncbi:hypothetical protein VP01_620g3 [Puccinia sorghi]|uniref:Uncharacterized protein n=1 Tax=Puccinia sorghi TaxID=27349 RepID=A0A0L6UGN7_9BASI|nr:hypothetical protein VP01_620g3 [Puccinia sorghi]
MVKGSDIILILVAVIFPPAAALFVTGCGCDLLINILLTMSLGISSWSALALSSPSLPPSSSTGKKGYTSTYLLTRSSKPCTRQFLQAICMHSTVRIFMDHLSCAETRKPPWLELTFCIQHHTKKKVIYKRMQAEERYGHEGYKYIGNATYVRDLDVQLIELCLDIHSRAAFWLVIYYIDRSLLATSSQRPTSSHRSYTRAAPRQRTARPSERSSIPSHPSLHRPTPLRAGLILPL